MFFKILTFVCFILEQTLRRKVKVEKVMLILFMKFAKDLTLYCLNTQPKQQVLMTHNHVQM